MVATQGERDCLIHRSETPAGFPVSFSDRCFLHDGGMFQLGASQVFHISAALSRRLCRTGSQVKVSQVPH